MKVVLIFSGGVDSTTLLYDLLHQGHEVRALSIDYGQRHGIELESAQRIVNGLRKERAMPAGLPHQILNFRGLRPLLTGSSQTDPDVPVPEGYYTDESMRATVVPGRNLLMLAAATAWAIASKSEAVAYAAHAGDHPVYVDCRPAFAEAMGAVMRLADEHPVEMLRPFINLTKRDIISLGASLGVPYALTWSCYAPIVSGQDYKARNTYVHCGRCGTDRERIEAFEQAGIPDPTHYA